MFAEKKQGLGVDIGSGHIKVVCLEERGNLIRLLGYNIAPTPPKTFLGNSLKNKEEIATTINKLLLNSKIRPITLRKVFTSIPEQLAFIKVIQIPQMSEKETNEAVRWEIDQSLPMSVDDVYWDYTKINEISLKDGKPKQEIILTAAPKKLVADYMDIFNMANLEVEAIEVEPIPITRALVKNEGASSSLLIVDIGATSTSIIIFDKGSVRFAGSALYGGDMLTQSIAEKLNINPKQALKIKESSLRKDQEMIKVEHTIEPVLEKIASEIERSIKFYQDRSKSKLEKVLLCGGSVNLTYLQDYLSKKIKITTEIGNPWANVTTYPLKAVPKTEIPIYTTAIGLALRNIKDF